AEPIASVAMAPELSLWREAVAMLREFMVVPGQYVEGMLQAIVSYLRVLLVPVTPWLPAFWAASALLLLTVLVALAVRLERQRRSWSERTVDDVRVLLSEDVGP